MYDCEAAVLQHTINQRLVISNQRSTSEHLAYDSKVTGEIVVTMVARFGTRMVPTTDSIATTTSDAKRNVRLSRQHHPCNTGLLKKDASRLPRPPRVLVLFSSLLTAEGKGRVI